MKNLVYSLLGHEFGFDPSPKSEQLIFRENYRNIYWHLVQPRSIFFTDEKEEDGGLCSSKISSLLPTVTVKINTVSKV